MTETLITYLFIWGLAIVVAISFVIGLEKMIKVIIWNYILWTICLALSASLDLLINTVGSWLAKFLMDGKTTIILIVYALFLFLIYRKSKITINIPADQILQKSLYLVFVPLTVLSMFLILEIIFIGPNVFVHQILLEIAQWFSQSTYLQLFIINTPYLFLAHGVITVFVASEFKLKFKTDLDI